MSEIVTVGPEPLGWSFGADKMSLPLLSECVRHTLVLCETLLSTAARLDARLAFPPASQRVRLRQRDDEEPVVCAPPLLHLDHGPLFVEVIVPGGNWRMACEVEITHTHKLVLSADESRVPLELGTISADSMLMLTRDWAEDAASYLGLEAPIREGSAVLPGDAEVFLRKRITQLKDLKRKAMDIDTALALFPLTKKLRRE